MRSFTLCAAVLALVAAAGCPKKSDVTVETVDAPSAPSAAPHAPQAADPHAGMGGTGAGGQLPSGHPPVGGGAVMPGAGGAGAAVETDGHAELPVKKKGINSREELDRGLKTAVNDDARKHFEAGFRYAFTTRQELRQYALAETELRKAIEIDPNLAEAYRALGYAVFNKNLNFNASLPLYKKAVELKPDYGEAHYALAFLFGAMDPSQGRDHFRKAMALGVPDERQLGPRFYPDVK